MIFAFYREKKNNVLLDYIIFLALFVDSPIASMQWKVIVSAFCILKIIFNSNLMVLKNYLIGHSNHQNVTTQ